MGALFVTLLSFVLGLIVCGIWASLNSLGLVPLPPLGSLDGVIGLCLCSGVGVGVVLQIVWG